MKKKLIILLSTLTMVFSLIVPSAFAQGETFPTDYNELLKAYQDCALPDSTIDFDELLNNYVANSDCTDPSKVADLKDTLENIKGAGIKGASIDQLKDMLDAKSNKGECTKEQINEPCVEGEDCDVHKDVKAAPVPTTQEPTASQKPIETPTATEKPVESTPVSTQKPVETPTATEKPVESTPVPTQKPVETQKPVATSTPNNNSSNASAIEKRMVDLVNQDRANAGLPPLAIDSGLTSAARTHSQDMSANNYFSHTSPTKGGFSERLRNSGVSYKGAGENIALYNSVEKAQAGLMSSDGHRANILGSSFTHIGIGIVWNESKGAYYITQWFARK